MSFLLPPSGGSLRDRHPTSPPQSLSLWSPMSFPVGCQFCGIKVSLIQRGQVSVASCTKTLSQEATLAGTGPGRGHNSTHSSDGHRLSGAVAGCGGSVGRRERGGAMSS